MSYEVKTRKGLDGWRTTIIDHEREIVHTGMPKRTRGKAKRSTLAEFTKRYSEINGQFKHMEK